MQTLPDLVNLEGDEEVQYVLMDLPNTARGDELAPGTEVLLRDIDSDNPKLQLGTGPVLQGTWTDHLGTVILFKHTDQSAEGAAPSRRGCKLLGLSESRLVFKRAPGPEPPRQQQLPASTTAGSEPAQVLLLEQAAGGQGSAPLDQAAAPGSAGEGVSGSGQHGQEPSLAETPIDQQQVWSASPGKGLGAT